MMTLQSNSDVLAVPRINELDDMSPDNVITTLDDRGVRRTIECISNPQYPYRPLTTFAMAHSDTHIYIDFFVRCNFLRAVNYETNTPVFEDSAVAAMIQPNPCDSTFYVLTFNCIGTVLGLLVRSGQEPEPISPEILARIQRVASCGTRPFRELEGLFSWNILVSIPLDVLGICEDSWPCEVKGNFYKCATGTSQPHFLSWLPIEGNFPLSMQSDKFGRILLD
jgi:hypothetical protein